MNTNLVTMLHGSHLYGLNTENSDKDFKSVFMPDLKSVLLGQVVDNYATDTNPGKTKNTSADTDHKHFSFLAFVNMCKKNEMIAMDMLHAPLSLMKEVHDPENNPFMTLWERRYMFYSKDMRAYMGYVKKQAAKYGIKGSRIHSLRVISNTIRNLRIIHASKLESVRQYLPIDEYCIIHEDGYEVMGKLHQWTVSIESFLIRIEKALEAYGNRALEAEKNEGVDWKAASHALRAGYQILSIAKDLNIEFPFTGETKEVIMRAKLGQMDFVTEYQPRLEQMIADIDVAMKKSILPDSIDHAKIDKMVYLTMTRFYGIEGEWK